MSQLPVSIHGKIYNINCADDERETILKMSEYVNYKIAQVAPKCKSMNDITLLSFTLLAVADDVAKAYESNERLENKIKEVQAQYQSLASGQPSTEVYIKEIEALKKKLAYLSEAKGSQAQSDYQKEIDSLKQQLASSMASHTEQQNHSNEAYIKEIESLKGQISILSQSDDDSQASQEIYLKEIESLKEQIATLSKTEAEHHSSQETYIKEIDVLKQEVALLKQELSQKMSEAPQGMDSSTPDDSINHNMFESMISMIRELSSEIKTQIPTAS